MFNLSLQSIILRSINAIIRRDRLPPVATNKKTFLWQTKAKRCKKKCTNSHTGITASQPAGVDGRSGRENIMIGQLWTVGELLNASNDTSRQRPARPTRQMGGIYARKRAMIMRPTEGERKREATKKTACTESRVGSRHEAGGKTGQQSCKERQSTLLCVPE